MRFGVHMPQAGGFKKNVERVAALGCKTIQIFPGNPTGWRMGKLEPKEADKRAALLEENGIYPLVVHSAYLINLASKSDDVFFKSQKLLNETMERAALLKAPYVILHTGNHGGQGKEKGLKQITESIKEGLENWPASVKLLLENTAGSGTALGADFNDLGEILSAFPRDTLGVCIDTAHAWAAGYHLSSQGGVEKSINALKSAVGLEYLQVIHVNGTRVKPGSRVDRHAHIGEGNIGKDGFAALLNYGWPEALPVILETPENGTDWDRANLDTLYELAGE
ncbi:MAG: deoxyribonuclease IV [Bacillota bacterium]